MFSISRRLLSMIVFAGVLAALLVPAAGCTSTNGYETFVSAADTAANVTIGPRYAEYVSADASLTIEQKTTYLNELQAFRSVVAEAKRDGVSSRGPP